MKKLILTIVSIVLIVLLLLYFRKPENDVAVDTLYLSPDEITELNSLGNNEYVMGIIENDSTSEFILSNVANKFGLDFTFQYFSEYNDLLESVELGEIDFASGITYNDDRNEYLEFTSPVDIENIYLISDEKYLVENMYGKTIGVARDTIYEEFIIENFGNVTIVYYDTIEEFFELINDGSVDGSIGNIEVFEEALRQGLEIALLNDKISIKPVSIISKDNSNELLLSLFTRYIKTNEYKYAIKSYKEIFFDEIYKVILDEKIFEYYPNNDIEATIKLENYPPISYIDKEGVNKGIFADVLFSICNMIDMQCEISSVTDETWDSMFGDLKNGEIDLLGPVTKTVEREEYLYFTNSIITSRYVMLSRNDYINNDYDGIYQLLHEKIGVVTNDIKHDYLKSVFPNKEFIHYDSNEKLIKGLSNGEVDYILYNEFIYFEYTFESKDFSISVNENIGTVIESELCFAFAFDTDGEQLSEIFSLAIELVDIKEIENEYINNLSPADYYQKDTYIRNLITTILVIIIVSLIFIIVIFFIFIKRLKYIADRDSLTGIYNRRYYELKLLELNKAKFYPLSIIVSDINGLKLINDAFGHKVGDDLLIAAVETFKKHTSTNDLVARVGGDEFIILLPNTSLSDTEEIVIKMINDNKHFKINTIDLSISYGLGVMTSSKDSYQEVYKVAEDAMYRTKLIDVPSMRSNTINAIIKTLYEKDAYSEGHSKSVSLLSEQIAKKMNLKFEDVSDIKTAGLLHDIGKIIVPINILNRVGKLNEEEFEEMKKHSEIGYRILSSTNEMSILADFVLSHHERWDGKGYPNGLKGEEIPIQSRIITVADAFDAMTSSRTYRSTITHKEALEEIINCSGSQFDPRIVKLFKTHFSEIMDYILDNNK